MTRDEARTFLGQNLESVWTHLFPAAKRDGAHFVVGNIEGAPGESFRVCLQGANRGLYKDFASGEKASRDLIGLWMKARCVSFQTALSEIAAFAGVAHSNGNGKESSVERIRSTFDWAACVRALTKKRLAELAEWRGYTMEFCRTLAADGKIGLYEGRIAFPVHDQAGNVVGPHFYVAEKHDWFYTKGTKVRPLVYGDIYSAGEVHLFESQWDALGVMERCGLYKESGVAFFITRGSGNAKLVRGRLPDSADVLVWPQNDKPDDDGAIPSEKWLEGVIKAASRRVRLVRTPKEYEDANAWTRVGTSAEEIGRVMIQAEVREKPEVAEPVESDESADSVGKVDVKLPVRLPRTGRQESEFTAEIGAIIGPLKIVLRHGDRVVEISSEEFTGELDHYRMAKGGLKFAELTAVTAKTWIEQYLTTGTDVKNELTGAYEFKAKTMNESLARTLLKSPQFLKQIPRVSRILDIPVPIRTKAGKIVYPNAGFNKSLGIYCSPDAPAITLLPLDKAREVIEITLSGFCWKDEQSKVHAIARLLSSYGRGLMGFHARGPLWFYTANRPRAGKDYLAGVHQIVYQGQVFEDAALGDSPEETRKRSPQLCCAAAG